MSTRFEGEQLRLPGMGPADPREGAAGQGSKLLEPPTFPDEPRVFKPEGGELSPWQQVRLDREHADLDRTAAETEIMRAAAAAEIEERRQAREAAHWDSHQRRESELETARVDRRGRQVERYVMLALLVIAGFAVIVLTFLTLESGQGGRVPATSGAGVVALVASLRLLALGRGDSASIWDWLIQRQGSKT
jgi:hypothetical protein